jgi:hypothetical protein
VLTARAWLLCCPCCACVHVRACVCMYSHAYVCACHTMMPTMHASIWCLYTHTYMRTSKKNTRWLTAGLFWTCWQHSLHIVLICTHTLSAYTQCRYTHTHAFKLTYCRAILNLFAACSRICTHTLSAYTQCRYTYTHASKKNTSRLTAGLFWTCLQHALHMYTHIICIYIMSVYTHTCIQVDLLQGYSEFVCSMLCTWSILTSIWRKGCQSCSEQVIERWKHNGWNLGFQYVYVCMYRCIWVCTYCVYVCVCMYVCRHNVCTYCVYVCVYVSM